MKQTTLPEVIYLDVDSLSAERVNNAALVAAIEEPINEIGVI